MKRLSEVMTKHWEWTWILWSKRSVICLLCIPVLLAMRTEEEKISLLNPHVQRNPIVCHTQDRGWGRRGSMFQGRNIWPLILNIVIFEKPNRKTHPNAGRMWAAKSNISVRNFASRKETITCYNLKRVCDSRTTLSSSWAGPKQITICRLHHG